MNAIFPKQFGGYFDALHGHGPYPWQERLAEKVAGGDWPGAIDLPTGSGKTACLDVATFALASQATSAPQQRSVPRRIFFCVNRRVIVDEAYERARHIARKLAEAEGGDGILADMAAALRRVAGTEQRPDVPPLDVLELRGGIYRDNRWARSLTQPTIICTTLDQLGSRLLFRGYGVSNGAAPIHAALIAYDSLVLLDEAHISEPFRQTLESVSRYLDPEKWAEAPIGPRPLTVVPMTATPNEAMQRRGVVRLEPEDRDPELPLLARLTATKPAELREVKDVAKAAVRAAVEAAGDGPVAVGIVVNRVATARAIYEELRKRQITPARKKDQIPLDVDIELVIGSMRPIDRDHQAERLRGLVGADRPKPRSTRTSFVVATQCLEVGADYDFDALVTECASLDALRQRFGRLNRAGRDIEARAVVLASQKDLKPEEKLDDEKPLDPIYGNALARTWHWLHEQASVHKTEDDEDAYRVDFGIDAFKALLEAHGEDGRPPRKLLSPAAARNAPVMMPAYVDLWSQTAPRPVPDPDVSLFIHGEQGGEPDVQVSWRADIGEGDGYPGTEHWCDVVALLPPTSAECMRVPLSRMRQWLAGQLEGADRTGDTLGEAGGDKDEKTDTSGRLRPAVIWRGVSDSRLIEAADDLKSGDTLVLPAHAPGSEALGHLPVTEAGAAGMEGDDQPSRRVPDCAEQAFRLSRDRVALRMHPSLRHHFPEGPAIDALFEAAGEREEAPAAGQWIELLVSAAEEVKQRGHASLSDTLAHLAKTGFASEPYPDGRGLVFTGRRRLGSTRQWFVPSTDEGEDESSRLARQAPVLLEDHTRHVVEATRGTTRSLPLSVTAALFEQAARLHDLGKADDRFQALLRRSDRTDAWLMAGAELPLLAKSAAMPPTQALRRQARERAGLPEGFRHEMASLQLAASALDRADDPIERNLLLHLIAAHHGHARPFAPVVFDEESPGIEVEGHTLTHEQRSAHVPHRLDSGIPERFWQLTRHHGWWGLAYLESVLRLADQQASADEEAGRYDDEMPHQLQETAR